MICGTEGLEPGPVLVLPEECTEPFMVTDIDSILGDDSVDAVVEAIGGTEPAGSFAERVLLSGKHLVTSNKAMVAERGIELAGLARERGKAFLFSAACGGGVPFLHNISAARGSDRILSMSGILNGTTNYILDAMQSDGLSPKEALEQARELGYAEADPTADLSGMDSYRKIVLACAVAYGIQPYAAEEVEGIYGFTDADAQLIKLRGGEVRLIARGGLNENGSVYSYVEPRVFFSGTEKEVRKNFNCASYVGEKAGLITMIGQGAGRYPTASAVLRDLTGILNGITEMMPDGCRREKENNTPAERYFVRCAKESASAFSCSEIWYGDEEKICFVTAPIRVRDMHERVRELRKEGRSIFFASV